MSGHIHAAKHSVRLLRLENLLRAVGSQGATTRDIVMGAHIMAVNAAVAELRFNGVPVRCVREGRIYRYFL